LIDVDELEELVVDAWRNGRSPSNANRTRMTA
jgi:hypothetical protein